MTNNTNLQKAKTAKLYTLYSDIEAELEDYKGHFKGKKVYLPCDNPDSSNFWNYFYNNFDALRRENFPLVQQWLRELGVYLSLEARGKHE